MRKQYSLILMLTVFLSTSFSFQRINNFSSTISVYDFESQGDTLYVASSGGVYVFIKSSGTGYLLPSDNNSPDPTTTALFLQDKQKLWYGTNQGYLCKRTPPDNKTTVTTYNSYFSSQWKITGLELYGKYLFVASNKGLSVFDTEKGYAEKSASKFGNMTTSAVNALKVYNDTLFIGLDQGIAKLSVKTIDAVNFSDPRIWEIDQVTLKPVHSFTIYNNICKPFSDYSDLFQGKFIYSSDSSLYWDSSVLSSFNSKITALKVTGEKECWIGTEEDYFYLWNGASLTQYKIPGPTQASINKVFVDHTGKMWFLPYANGNVKILPWWLGIGSFDNNSWTLYNLYTTPSFDGLNDNPDNRAIIETPDNRVWFGTSGGQVKTYTPASNSWRIYHVNSLSESSFYAGNQNDRWGKSDAFAIDSSGYLWISSWKNKGGSLICYDYRYEPDDSKRDNPEQAHYRRFFSDNDDYNFTCINVDKQGNILIGDENGRIIVFRHNGNPLRDGITVLTKFNTYAKVYDAVTSVDDSTRIVTADGLYVFNSQKLSITKNEDFNMKVRTIEAESDSVVWIGTSGDGLTRYDVTSKDHSTFTIANGLISNEIKDISFDKKNGHLWVATDLGFSMIDVGYVLDRSPTVKDIEIYPNPYSKSKMAQYPITIRNVSHNGKIAIYSVDGRLIAKPRLQRQGNGSSYIWEPETNITPGVYRVIIHGSQSCSKLLLVSP